VPKRASNTGKHRHTKVEEQNLERFGCTFSEKNRVVYIDWRENDMVRAANAEIFARLVFVNNDLGPIAFLACEISPVRPLPRYCYFPFDLTKQGHRDYLCRFAETGEIRLRFLSGTKTLDRMHRLTPYLRARTAETYAEALRGWENWEGKHDSDAALRLFERHARIPLFLERVIFDDSLAEGRANAKQAAEAVPNENRDLAMRIVREIAEAFGPYYRTNGKALFENFNAARAGLLSMIDLRRMFADNPSGLIDFASDALASSFSHEELENVGRMLTVTLLLFKLPFREQLGGQLPASTERLMPPIPAIPIPLVDMFQSIAISGIPKNATSRLLELLGLEVGGQPGRHTKDYSREYELKMSGSSWTQVARSALGANLELQEEFGTRDYRSLDRSQQELLKNRIRQGVSAYVKRTGNPAPSESDGADSASPEREQEIP